MRRWPLKWVWIAGCLGVLTVVTAAVLPTASGGPAGIRLRPRFSVTKTGGKYTVTIGLMGSPASPAARGGQSPAPAKVATIPDEKTARR